MSPLEQLIMKKMQEGKKMSPMEQKAKLASLADLKSEMHGMMKDHLAPDEDGEDADGAHIEVAAASPEAAKMGLDKAKEAMDVMPEHEDADVEHDAEDEEDEMSKPHAEGLIEGQIEHEAAEGDLSPEEIDQLQMLLAKLKMKKA